MSASFDCDDELQQIDCDLADAWMALGDARAAYFRSPNAERLTFASMAERTVDELLELRHEMTAAERQPALTNGDAQ